VEDTVVRQRNVEGAAEREHSGAGRLQSWVVSRQASVNIATNDGRPSTHDYSWGNGLFSAGTIGARSF
jgi:hypothetical protein